jgi:hypothetical protein
MIKEKDRDLSELKDISEQNLAGLTAWLEKEDIIAKELGDTDRISKVSSMRKILSKLQLLYRQL